MQIHEITVNTQLDEGILDTAKSAAQRVGSAYQSVKGGVQGAVQGYQQAKTDRLTTQATTDLTNKAAQVWNQYAKNLKANTPDPQRYTELYKQALTAFTQKNLLKNQAIKNSINQQEITQLVDAITAAKDNPQQVTQLIGKLVQQAALSRPDVDSQAAQQNIEVISRDPSIIKFQGSTYGLNDQGRWSNIKTGAVPEQSVEAFLDKAAGTS